MLELGFGSSTVRVPLPERSLLGVLEPRPLAAVPIPPVRFWQAFESGTGALPLQSLARSGRSAVILEEPPGRTALVENFIRMSPWRSPILAHAPGPRRRPCLGWTGRSVTGCLSPDTFEGIVAEVAAGARGTTDRRVVAATS